MRKNPYKTIYKEPLTREAKVKIVKMILFWGAFAVFVIALFSINMPRIRATMRGALWPAWFRSRSSPPVSLDRSPDTIEHEAEQAAGETPDISVSSAAPASKPAPPAPSVSPTATPTPSGQPPRERSLYFIQVDRGGAILRAKVTRAVPSSNAPLLDVLEALLKGPTPEERRQGIISLIPQGTKILSASVLRDTAYINISEEFQYNTFGVEGYAAQLVQIVWTATEFANVKDAQILIDGRRIDYLGEGIWIGSPITRDPLRGF